MNVKISLTAYQEKYINAMAKGLGMSPKGIVEFIVANYVFEHNKEEIIGDAVKRIKG